VSLWETEKSNTFSENKTLIQIFLNPINRGFFFLIRFSQISKLFNSFFLSDSAIAEKALHFLHHLPLSSELQALSNIPHRKTMASSSVQAKKLPFAGGWSEAVLSKLPPDTVLEPVMNTERRKIWENQVMFPYTIAGRTCAFGGPLPDAKNKMPAIMKIFPVYEPCQPRAFMNTTHNFSFIKPPNKVFRSAPYYGNEDYIAWLDRVQVGYGDFWKDSGIYELIQLSRVGPKYQQEMIIAAMHFFESSTNTFHFECGMMTPTLFDVAAITGLSPVGDAYDPAKTTQSIEFDYKEKTFKKYIQENHQAGEEEVSDIEHIAFLTLWLSHYIFCSKSLQVAKKFIPMAIQLHQGQQFGLGRLVLGCLYESMQSLSANLKKTGDGSCFLAAGPFWLLQFWLNATFEK
jgi:hypothetical protein